MTNEEKQFRANVKLSIENVCHKADISFVEGRLKVELPFKFSSGETLRLYFIKGTTGRSKKHIAVVCPIYFMKDLPDAAVSAYSNVLETFEVRLSVVDGDFLIIEDSTKPLHTRIGIMIQAMLGIDGILRARKLITNGKVPATGS